METVFDTEYTEKSFELVVLTVSVISVRIELIDWKTNDR